MPLIEALDFTFDGIVFKHALDTKEPLLVLEIRNHETLRVSFAVIDLEHHALLAHFVHPEEDWWVSLECSIGGNVWLQGFRDEENPVREGVTRFNVREDAVEFMDAKASILEYGLESVHLSGEIGSWGLERVTNKDFPEPIYPQHYPQETPYFDTVASFISSSQGFEPKESIEYAETGFGIIISYYLYSDTRLDNYLQVVDQEGQVIFQDCLGVGLTGIGLNTFFCYEDLLLFVKNKHELVGISFSDHSSS